MNIYEQQAREKKVAALVAALHSLEPDWDGERLATAVAENFSEQDWIELAQYARQRYPSAATRAAVVLALRGVVTT